MLDMFYRKKFHPIEESVDSLISELENHPNKQGTREFSAELLWFMDAMITYVDSTTKFNISDNKIEKLQKLLKNMRRNFYEDLDVLRKQGKLKQDIEFNKLKDSIYNS